MKQFGEQLTIDELKQDEELELQRLQRVLILGAHAAELGME